jgi:multisubunit Na+/H+ antiporter MnhF subunit
MEAIQKLEQNVENTLKPMLSNPYVMAVLKVTLVLYAAQLAPKLPTQISDFFNNSFVKMLAIFLIAYITQVDFQLALILAIVFVVGSNVASGRGFLESYGNVYRSTYNEDRGPYYADQTKYQTLLQQPVAIGNQKLIESSSDNYPGCLDVKMSDLLALFDNDHMKMQTTVQYAIQELMSKLSGAPKDNLVKVARAIGYPYNVTFTDENAPLLATMLVNYGYVVSPSCQPPQ